MCAAAHDIKVSVLFFVFIVFCVSASISRMILFILLLFLPIPFAPRLAPSTKIYFNSKSNISKRTSISSHQLKKPVALNAALPKINSLAMVLKASRFICSARTSETYTEMKFSHCRSEKKRKTDKKRTYITK